MIRHIAQIATALSLLVPAWGMLAKSRQADDKESRQIEQNVFRLVNEQREEHNLKTLTQNDVLAKAAREQAQRCADSGELTRECHQYGGSLGDRLKKASYQFRAVGENLSSRRTAQDIVQGWMNSAGHRKSILNPVYAETGVGTVAKGRLMITCQIYATTPRKGAKRSLESSGVTIELDVVELPDEKK